MRNVFLALLLAGTLTACKKEDTGPPSNTDLLTEKNWRLTASTITTISSTGNTTTDVYATQPPCLRDNFMTYKRDNSLVFDEGPIKCSPATQQTTSIPWAWQDNETSLAYTISTISGSGVTGTATDKWEVIELTASTLHLRHVLQQYFGGSDSLIEDRTYTSF